MLKYKINQENKANNLTTTNYVLIVRESLNNSLIKLGVTSDLDTSNKIVLLSISIKIADSIGVMYHESVAAADNKNKQAFSELCEQIDIAYKLLWVVIEQYRKECTSL